MLTDTNYILLYLPHLMTPGYAMIHILVLTFRPT